MATEDEEFEFRLRAEREAAMRPAGAPAPARQPVADIPGTPAGYADRVAMIPGAAPGMVAPQAQRPAPVPQEERGLFSRIRAGVEAARNTIASIVPGGVGFGLGAAEGMLRNIASGKFGTQEGAGLVEQTAAKRAQQFTEAAVAKPPSALGQEYVQDVGEFMQRHGASALAGPLGVTGTGRHTQAVGDVRTGLRAALGTPGDAPPGLPPVAPSAEKPAGGLAKRAVQPNPALLEDVKSAEKAGLTVLPHHVAEGEAVRALGTAAGGDVYKQNTKAFTKALIKELDPDETAARLDTKTFHRVLDKQGKTIGENMAKYDMPVDDALRARLEAISKDAADNADADTGRMTMNRVRDVFDKAEAGEGRIAGQAVRELDTAIGRQIRHSTKNQDLVARLRAVQDVLRDTAERQMAPDEAKAVQQARRRYAYAMEILPDIDDFGRTGYYEPGQLWKRLTSSEAGRQRVANERGGLTDLAKAGALVADRSGAGHGYVSVGSSGVGVGASGMRAYASPSRIAEVAIGAIGGKKAYNRFGPGLVRRLAAEHDAELARAAQAPEPPPLELAAPDAPTPQGPRPDVRGEAPAEVPEWTTTAGVDAQKPGSQIPAIEPDGLLPAVGDDIPPARINPEPRGRVPDIPAVPGRPGMPDVMVAGGPDEVAGNLASGVTGAGRKGPLRETTGTNEAMLSPDAALARVMQGYAPKKPEPPTGGGGGGGTPSIDPRLAKIAELRRQAPSAAVKKVLDAREAEIKKVIKRETDISELEAAAQATDDVGLRQSLLAEANKLRGGKLPVGEVTEGMPDLPKPKAEKIPVGKVIEGQPDLPVDKAERIPVGEATEITPEVVEAAPERIPVGEATEMPEPLPVGEVVEDPIPVGDAMEFEPLPVGEVTEITPELVVPEATNVDNAPTAPAGGGRSEGMEQAIAAHKMTRQEYEAANPGESYDRALVREADFGEIPYSAIEWKARITGFGKPKIWAMTRKEIQALADNAARAGRASVAQWRKMAPAPGLPKWAIESHRRMDKASVAHEVEYYRGLLGVHKERVEEAIAHGADVPETVLKDYPDLTTQPKENTRTDPQPTPAAPAGGGRSEGMEQTKGFLTYIDEDVARAPSAIDRARRLSDHIQQLEAKLNDMKFNKKLKDSAGIAQYDVTVKLRDLKAARTRALTEQPTAQETPRAPQEVTQQAGVPAEPQGRTGGREAAEAGFDADAWQKTRDDRVKASRAAGNTHLDTLPAYVESMRGKTIRGVHDQKVTGKILTVDNRGNVYVEWTDAYSQEKEGAVPMQMGRRKVMQTSLGPRDLKDYIVASDAAPPKGREAAEAGAGDRIQRAAESGGQAEGAKKEGVKPARSATKPTGNALTPAEVKAELVRQLDEAQAKAGGEKFTPDDVSGPRRENGDQVLRMQHQPNAEQPYNIYLRAVRDDKDSYWTIYGRYGATGKEAPLDRTAPGTTPASAKRHLALLMPNVAEKDGVLSIKPRDDFVTVRAGGSEYKIRNTRERIAEFKKELLDVKSARPITEKATDALSKRAPLKTITDMIDDLDPQAAVDFAAAQGIDLEVALKGDRKRLDQVRGLKPTPPT